MNTKESNKLVFAGILTAVGASLCCITPVLALLAGTTGVASTFSWLEPFRPYIIGVTVAVLAFAWYQKIRPATAQELACACEDDEKPSFWQSKKFLGIVTIFAAVMLAFPYYSHMFYPTQDKEVVLIQSSNIETTSFSIKGMTCQGCAAHVENEVNKLEGIVAVKASYDNGNAIVEFDKTKVKLNQIESAINSTEYEVTAKSDNSQAIK